MLELFSQSVLLQLPTDLRIFQVCRHSHTAGKQQLIINPPHPFIENAPVFQPLDLVFSQLCMDGSGLQQRFHGLPADALANPAFIQQGLQGFIIIDVADENARFPQGLKALGKHFAGTVQAVRKFFHVFEFSDTVWNSFPSAKVSQHGFPGGRVMAGSR